MPFILFAQLFSLTYRKKPLTEKNWSIQSLSGTWNLKNSKH